jgi:hypothetical protein
MGLIPHNLGTVELVVTEYEGRPSIAEATIMLSGSEPTHELAKARMTEWLAARRFPKALSMYSTSLYNYRAEGDLPVGHIPMARNTVKLWADGVNGGRNETGIRRLQRLVAFCREQGVPFEYVTGYANAYPTLDEAMAAVAK